MALTKVIGQDLQFGVTSSGLNNVLEQSATRTKLGELKEFKDKDGNTVSVYKTSDTSREEISFEAILKGDADYKIGDSCTIMGKQGVVSKFDIIESNEDAKKVSMTIRTYPDVQ